MKLVINKDRSVIPVGTWGTVNENNYEILEFEFPAELDNYNKRIVYYLDDKRVWDAIVNNKVAITNAVTAKEHVKAYVWLTLSETITLKYICNGTEEGNYYFTYDNINHYFTIPEVSENDELIYDVATNKLKLANIEVATTTTGTGTELTFDIIIDADEDFRTQLFEMNFYENENADGIVPTQEQVDGFNTILTAMNNKIAEVNALEQTIETAEAQRQEAEVSREERTNEAIENIVDMTADYNQNAENKTSDFNTNASQKTTDFNANASQKTNEFNTNAENKTTNFNENVTTQIQSFDTHVEQKTDDFDGDASIKKQELEDIADGVRNMATAIQLPQFYIDNRMRAHGVFATKLSNVDLYIKHGKLMEGVIELE